MAEVALDPLLFQFDLHTQQPSSLHHLLTTTYTHNTPTAPPPHNNLHTQQPPAVAITSSISALLQHLQYSQPDGGDLCLVASALRLILAVRHPHCTTQSQQLTHTTTPAVAITSSISALLQHLQYSQPDGGDLCLVASACVSRSTGAVCLG
jgi:hypothetical protein